MRIFCQRHKRTKPSERIGSDGVSHRVLAALLVLAMSSWPAKADEIELPSLGDTITGIMSPNEEKTLGQAWLRSFRASVQLDEDPVVYEYVEDLLFQLASHSDLDEKQIDLVMVQDPSINAFAVPGGVVGVHTGLIDAANSESQFASVLTHELAHLSQRHFARSMDAAKQANMVSILGALAGVAIAAAGGSGDAVTAALITGQAAALDSRLRYSRAHEREADRIGMHSLVDAGYAADGAAQMFQEMQNAFRLYGQRLPEFLLTHPITQSRISDARQRDRQIEKESRESGVALENIRDGIGFQLIKARIYARDQDTADAAIKHFERELKGLAAVDDSESNLAYSEEERWRADASRYGLSLSQLRANQFGNARETLIPLLQQVPGKIIYALLDIEIDIAEGKLVPAERRLRDLYSLNPNNFGISMTLAELLLKVNKPKDAERILQNLADLRPSQSIVWYHLAEAQGKAGKILALHRSRAEFFQLIGAFDRAIDHLQQAYRLAGKDFQTAATIRQRVNELIEIKKRQQALGIG